jgi:hypothetical protein
MILLEQNGIISKRVGDPEFNESNNKIPIEFYAKFDS